MSNNNKKRFCKFKDCNNELVKGQRKYCKEKHTVVCIYCNEEFLVHSSYPKENCSSKECVQKKLEDTCMKKYGVKNPYQSEEVKKKIAKTNKERYGAENPFQSEEIKEKIRQTNLKKYGVECTLQAPEVQEKIKKTNKERYGAENPFASDEIKEKIKKTNKERYGVENTFASEEIKEKIKQKNIEKYGVEYAIQSPAVQEKIRKTNIEKYGYPCVLQAPEMKEKIKETLMEKYGVDHNFKAQECIQKREQTWLRNYGVTSPLKSEEIKEKLAQTNLKKYGVKCVLKSDYFVNLMQTRYGVLESSQIHIKNINDYYNLENWYNENSTLTLKEICEYFNIHEATLRNRMIELDLGPYKDYDVNKSKYSGPELELKSILDANNIEYIPHDRQVIRPKEIDFLISGWNVGIEVSPDFTHNIKRVGEGYHKMKYMLAKNVGINLITLFSWYNVDKVMRLLLSNIENKEDEEMLTFEKLTEEMYTYILDNSHIDLDLVNLWDKREFVVGKDINGNIKGIAVFNKRTLTLEHMFTTNMYKCKEEKYLEFYRKKRGSARLLVNNNFNIYTLNNNYKLVKEMEDIVYLYARRYIDFNVGNITEQDIKADYGVKDVNAFLEQECYLLEGSGIMVYEYKKIENK